MKKTKLAAETADYPRAIWMPSPHFGFPTGAHDTNTPKFIIIHGTGYQADQTAQGVANDFATTNPNSAHFAIDRAGVVVQMVRVRDSAWANGVMTGPPGVARPGDDTSPHDAFWDAEQAKFNNLNNCTVSIEHVNDSNNDLAPTPAQMASSFALVAWLCKTYGIPARQADGNGGITGHYSIDPVARARCPGNYPFETLFAFLKGAVSMEPWLAPGAEAISEFARDHLGQYRHARCVETAATEAAIAQHPSFRNGIGNMGDFLNQVVGTWMTYGDGVDFQGASSYVDATRWLRGLGYKVDENVFDPSNWWEVLVAGLEQHSVFIVGVTNAQGLHGDEAGVQNHGLTAFGIDGNGNIICGDPDNQAANENMPGNPVGAFTVYTKQDLANGQVSSLTRVYPMAGVPQGWTDDGSKLFPPAVNGKQPTDPEDGTVICVHSGFRDQVMTEPWDARNIPLQNEKKRSPLEASNPNLGGSTPVKGSRQVFRWTVLEWREDTNHVFESWVGQELLFVEAHEGTPPPPPPPPTGSPTVPPDLHGALAAVLQLLQPAQQAANEVQTVMKELGF